MMGTAAILRQEPMNTADDLSFLSLQTRRPCVPPFSPTVQMPLETGHCVDMMVAEDYSCQSIPSTPPPIVPDHFPCKRQAVEPSVWTDDTCCPDVLSYRPKQAVAVDPPLIQVSKMSFSTSDERNRMLQEMFVEVPARVGIVGGYIVPFEVMDTEQEDTGAHSEPASCRVLRPRAPPLEKDSEPEQATHPCADDSEWRLYPLHQPKKKKKPSLLVRKGRKPFYTFAAEIKQLLDAALVDKIHNNSDWLRVNRLPGQEHTPKMMELMRATGLTSQQIREYFHNCIRRGVRMVVTHKTRKTKGASKQHKKAPGKSKCA